MAVNPMTGNPVYIDGETPIEMQSIPWPTGSFLASYDPLYPEDIEGTTIEELADVRAYLWVERQGT